MMTIDDYKMVLHNTAIVMQNCDVNDFPTLTRQFMAYDAIYHKLVPVGILL